MTLLQKLKPISINHQFMFAFPSGLAILGRSLKVKKLLFTSLSVTVLTFSAAIAEVAGDALVAKTVPSAEYEKLAKDFGKPISELPKNVKSTSGELSLFADYSARGPNGEIPVYLINRTKKVIKLGSQDGDIYLKLETQNEKGRWFRAQSHRYAKCGNSYFNQPTVLPNHFMKIGGYQPIDGKKKMIRFSLYQQSIKLSSNSDVGLVSAADIEEASKDAMAARQKAEQVAIAPALAAENVAAGWKVVDGQHPYYLKLKQKEILLKGTLIVEDYGEPGARYSRAPHNYWLMVGDKKISLQINDRVFPHYDNKSVELKVKILKKQNGKMVLLMVGWIREVDSVAEQKDELDKK